MAKFLNRVTVVDIGGGKAGRATTILKGKKGKKKRVTKWMRPTERAVRQFFKAERRCWTNLTSRHDKSRRKKRNRWLTDSPNNILRSMDKGCRVFSKV
jgi:hypothetical protein